MKVSKKGEVMKKENIGVVHGEWGERIAVELLRRKGWEIIDRNTRPYSRDERLELDIVAWDPATDTMVFVEVKQHKKHSPWERRLRSVDREKKRNLRLAANAWRRKNRWAGGYRFDVIEIYGEPGSGAPEIDHIENVRLFVPEAQFVRWG